MFGGSYVYLSEMRTLLLSSPRAAEMQEHAQEVMLARGDAAAAVAARLRR